MKTLFTIVYINDDNELETEKASTDMPYQPIKSERIGSDGEEWSCNAQVGDTFLGTDFFIIRIQ